jgi:hypothetical protein
VNFRPSGNRRVNAEGAAAPTPGVRVSRSGNRVGDDLVVVSLIRNARLIPQPIAQPIASSVIDATESIPAYRSKLESSGLPDLIHFTNKARFHSSASVALWRKEFPN